MNATQHLNEFEKIRLRLKIMWEGGLIGYMEYGVAKCLYIQFKEDFDDLYKYENPPKRKVHKLTRKIETFLDGNITSMNMQSIDMKKYNESGIDFNDYIYILAI